MESILAHLQNEISSRTAELMHAGQAGFEPVHADVRGPARSMPAVTAFSAAAPGDAQFMFYDKVGRRSFSRDGELHVEDGIVKSRDGKCIQGFSGNTPGVGELQVDAHDISLGRVHNLHIESDGAVCYSRTVIDPNTMQRRNERVAIGTLALARFPAGTQLVKGPAGDRPPFGIEPHIGRAGDGNFAMVQPGRVDAGRIDLNRALDRMHDLYTQLEAVTAANQARMGSDKTAMDLVK